MSVVGPKMLNVSWAGGVVELGCDLLHICRILLFVVDRS